MDEDKDRIRRRLEMIRHTFEQIMERDIEVQKSIHTSLTEFIEHLDGIENENLVEYMDLMTSAFMPKSQSYADYCKIIHEEVEATARYFEDDVKYMNAIEAVDFDEYDLRAEFDKLVKEITERVPISNVILIINDIAFAFDDYVQNMEDFLIDYKYAKEKFSIDPDLKEEFIKNVESLVYIQVSLDRIIEYGIDQAKREKEALSDLKPAKGISETDFRKMMGDE